MEQAKTFLKKLLNQSQINTPENLFLENLDSLNLLIDEILQKLNLRKKIELFSNSDKNDLFENKISEIIILSRNLIINSDFDEKFQSDFKTLFTKFYIQINKLEESTIYKKTLVIQLEKLLTEYQNSLKILISNTDLLKNK